MEMRGGPYHFLARIGIFLLVFAAGAQGFRLMGFAYPEIRLPQERPGDQFYIATDGFSYEHLRYMYQPDGPIQAARQADLLMLGNSRLMLGVSEHALHQQLAGHDIHAHWMGFQGESHALAEWIVKQRGGFEPALVLVNADGWYFEPGYSPFAKVYLARGAHGGLRDLRQTHRMNRQWRFFMKWTPVPQWNIPAGTLEHTRLPLIWRSLRHGDWVIGNWENDDWDHVPIFPPEEESLPADIADQRREASELVNHLRQLGSEVLFILVPNPDHGEATARHLAQHTGVTFVPVPWDDYRIFDGSHLDEVSAYRYTTAMLEAVRNTEEWQRAFGSRAP